MMDNKQTFQDIKLTGVDSEEDKKEWADILDEVDGDTFQKYYTKVMETLKSRKRAKEKRNKTKGEVKPDTQSPKPDEDEHEYDFQNTDRGMAIIINNETFHPESGLNDRNGSTKDADALEKMFEHLGFQVKRHVNLTAYQMVSKVLEAASNVMYDHNQADCFACAILSHGLEKHFEPKQLKDDPRIRHDAVFGVDGKIVPTQYLLCAFNDECCPELAEKPRLFFVQACRGETLDVGEEMKYFKVKTKEETETKTGDNTGHDHKDAVAVDSDDEFKDAKASICPKQPSGGLKADGSEGTQTTHQTQKVEILTETKSSEVEKSSKPLFTVSPSPIYKDFLLMYAAPPGYYAWRRNTGSWLIQTLEQVLTVKDVDKFSLTHLLTKVSRSVAMDYESNSSKKYLNKKKLVPCVMSMLTKDVYFRNKVK